MEQPINFLDSDGRRVSAVLRCPDSGTNKVVILCHGFLGYKDSWTNRILSEALGRQHVATLRFDFFGHGQSDGDLKELRVSTLVAQTEHAIALMHGHGFSHIALLGSSFGLVATLVAAKKPTLAALALRCPVVDFPALLRQRFGSMAIVLWRRLGHVPPSFAQIPLHYGFFEECLSYDMRRLAQDLRVPTIIVHGEHDEVIPVSQAEMLSRQIRAENVLHVIAGADHRFSRPEHFSEMTKLLVDWVVHYLSNPAPSTS